MQCKLKIFKSANFNNKKELDLVTKKPILVVKAEANETVVNVDYMGKKYVVK